MDEKSSARMSALLVASLCTIPWCRSGEMPALSIFACRFDEGPESFLLGVSVFNCVFGSDVEGDPT